MVSRLQARRNGKNAKSPAYRQAARRHRCTAYVARSGIEILCRTLAKHPTRCDHNILRESHNLHWRTTGWKKVQARTGIPKAGAFPRIRPMDRSFQSDLIHPSTNQLTHAQVSNNGQEKKASGLLEFSAADDRSLILLKTGLIESFQYHI